jgi:hypothetical protein
VFAAVPCPAGWGHWKTPFAQWGVRLASHSGCTHGTWAPDVARTDMTDQGRAAMTVSFDCLARLRIRRVVEDIRRGGVSSAAAPEWMAAWVPGPPSWQPRSSATRCPRGRAGRRFPRRQEVERRFGMGACGCMSYAPGHNCHVIQAGKANSDPNSWFPATVTALAEEEVTLKYEDGSTCRLWRHGGFDNRVAVGTALLACESWRLLSVVGKDGWCQLSVEVRDPSWHESGLSEDRPRLHMSGVVSNETGEGVDILHDEGRLEIPRAPATLISVDVSAATAAAPIDQVVLESMTEPDKMPDDAGGDEASMTAEEGIPLLRIQEELIGPLGVVTQFDFAKPDETVRRTKLGDLIKQLPLLLRRLLDDDGRWILICHLGDEGDPYVQFLATEDKVLATECGSNESIPGVLTPDQEEALPVLGWEWPQPPNKPNWFRTESGSDAVALVSKLATETMTEVLNRNENDEVVVRLFSGAPRSSGVTREAQASSPTVQADLTASAPPDALTQLKAQHDPMSAAVHKIETHQLVHGPVGEALASPDRPAEQLVDNLLQDLDRGDGWIVTDKDGGTWFPGRLAVDFRVTRVPESLPLLRVDTDVVRAEAETNELLELLNELNVHAAGWWWWLDRPSRTVKCSMSAVVDPVAWWWPMVLSEVLPAYATATESMADRIAEVTHGAVRLAAHPERGLRPNLDGFVVNTRLGPRDMNASMDLWLSTLDYSTLKDALGAFYTPENVHLQTRLNASIKDSQGQTRMFLRRHWHPEFGWGWQFSSLSGIATRDNAAVPELHRVASLMNMQQHAEAVGHNRFGGWVVIPPHGLTHLSFIPATVIAKVIDVAGSTAGQVAALMMDLQTRMDDLDNLVATSHPSLEGPLTMFNLTEEMADTELSMAHLKVGPVGWPYSEPRVQQRFQEGWRGGAVREGEDEAELWLLPRHMPICSFGIFNPVGPTVSSLELSYVVPKEGDATWYLYCVLRHPFSPQITYLGAAPTSEDIDRLITNALSETDPDTGVFGSGPDWLDIFSNKEAVVEGARQFALRTPETDWRLEATALLVHRSTPWARVTEGIKGDEFDWPQEVGAVEGWLNAVTHPDVIAGHQLFLRSAWEGAKAFLRSPESPQAAQTAMATVVEAGGARATADYEFRKLEGPWVKDATL